MSVKAMSLVWDFLCPSMIDNYEFKPNHKYVLLAYADHADHNGHNIWPAVPTIARKTGYVDRSVQRITDDLENMGMLISEGIGPRGTNKWFLPFSGGGDILTPVSKLRGDIDNKSLGDIPSGDIPSGDILTPELKEPNQEQYIKEINKIGFSCGLSEKPGVWKEFIEILENHTILKIDGGFRVLFVSGNGQKETSKADIYTDRYSKTFLNNQMILEFTETNKGD